MLKRFIEKYIKWKKKISFMRKWRECNQHNCTDAPIPFDIDHVVVGNYTYGTLNVIDYSKWSDVVVHLRIGSFCSIATDVVFLLGGNHAMNKFSTYPIDKFILNTKYADNKKKGDIIVDDDVWIGYGCIILAGVHIGKGAIIAAGTVVHEDVPEYSIYGSNGVIKYRFDDDIRNELKSINYGEINKDFIKQHETLFTANLTLDIAKEIGRLQRTNEVILKKY